MDCFVYPAQVVRVVDGDTLDVEIDLGFHIRTKERVRLYDIDTPEIFGSTAEPRGQAARAFVEWWLPEDRRVVLDSRKYDARGKYGRVLADIFKTGDVVPLNEALKVAGFEK